MVRVIIPPHLRDLAKVSGEIELDLAGAVSQRAILDALESRYPVLQGTIRDHVTQKRRPFVRFYACQHDFSHDPADAPLPEAIAKGTEPFLVVGAMVGG